MLRPTILSTESGPLRVIITFRSPSNGSPHGRLTCGCKNSDGVVRYSIVYARANQIVRMGVLKGQRSSLGKVPPRVSKVWPRQHGLIIIVNDGNIPWDVDFRGNSSIVAGGWLIESSISGGEVGYFFLQ